jgi:hypothetical protein
MACCYGVQFAIDRGVERLQVETDWQVLVNLSENPHAKILKYSKSMTGVGVSLISLLFSLIEHVIS